LAYGTASQEEEVDKLADRSGHARKGNMREHECGATLVA
jgi:hypothetical protein